MTEYFRTCFRSVPNWRWVKRVSEVRHFLSTVDTLTFVNALNVGDMGKLTLSILWFELEIITLRLLKAVYHISNRIVMKVILVWYKDRKEEYALKIELITRVIVSEISLLALLGNYLTNNLTVLVCDITPV